MIPFALTSLASAATFALKPFEATSETTDLALTATVVQDNNILSLSYLLTGGLEQSCHSEDWRGGSKRGSALGKKPVLSFFYQNGYGSQRCLLGV